MATDPPDEVSLDPAAFQKGHVAADPDRELATLLRVLDLQEQDPGIGRLRDWTVDRLAPRPGDTCVDVGCGTGAEVRRLARLVGAGGRAVGLEPHPGVRAEAVARAGAAGSAAAFQDGDALRLPFADASVDVLRCERVYQHLHDPGRAALEVARVLGPGGRAVIVDSDWGTMVAEPADPEVLRRYRESFWRRLPNPFAGRYLRRQLVAAGLDVDTDIGSSAFVLSNEMLADTGLAGMVSSQAELAVRAGDLDAEEARQLVTEIAEAARRGEALVSVTLFAVVARRPG